MPTWTPVDLDYEPYGGKSQPFASARTGFSTFSLAKSALAADSGRQEQFERQLARIADVLGSDEVPVFVRFRDCTRRMDKGCVGHAVARGFIEPPVDGPGGTVERVRIRRPARGRAT